MGKQTDAKTILVVDDDADYRLQIETLLCQRGFKVITAPGQQQAIDLLDDSTPDLAVVDLMMEHDDSGFIVSHHIKRKDASIPVILLTGLTSETGIEIDADTDEERSWVKADVVLDKPIRIEQLIREINRLLKDA